MESSGVVRGVIRAGDGAELRRVGIHNWHKLVVSPALKAARNFRLIIPAPSSRLARIPALSLFFIPSSIRVNARPSAVPRISNSQSPALVNLTARSSAELGPIIASNSPGSTTGRKSRPGKLRSASVISNATTRVSPAASVTRW